MERKTVTIRNRLGLHARAASLFVKTASRFASTITVSNSAREADGKRIMSVMLLQASYGTEIEIIALGEDETRAMAALEKLVHSKFGEGE